jgi:hypothetical protein
VRSVLPNPKLKAAPSSLPNLDMDEQARIAGDRKPSMESAMTSKHPSVLSRRGFWLCCAGSAIFAVTGDWLPPRQAFAEARGLVSLIKDSAAVSPIVTHKLRDDISVLEGSGGNVAVLTRPRRQGADRRRHQRVACADDQGARRSRHRSHCASHKHALACRPCRRERVAQYCWREDHRSAMRRVSKTIRWQLGPRSKTLFNPGRSTTSAA